MNTSTKTKYSRARGQNEKMGGNIEIVGKKMWWLYKSDYFN